MVFIPAEFPEMVRLKKKITQEEKIPLTEIEKLPPEYRDIADRLEKISGRWNMVEIYTPDSESVDREKAAMMAAYEQGEEYNPKFTYGTAERFELGDSREQLTLLLEKVNGLDTGNNRLQRLARVALHHKIRNDLATCDLVEGIQRGDEKRIKAGLNRKYRPLDPQVLEADKKEVDAAIHPPTVKEQNTGSLTLEQREYLDTRQMSIDERKKAYEWALEQYGLLKTKDDQTGPGFRVEVSSEVQFLDVRHRSEKGPTVFLNDGPESALDLIVLLRHEIDGHARQSANGQSAFRLGGGALAEDDEAMYEGLAMATERDFREKFFGPEGAITPRSYPFAVQLAEEGKSFSAIFETLVERNLHMFLQIPLDQALPAKNTIDPTKLTDAKNLAWRTTYRVMRGHVDMKNPEKYAMRKDLAYTQGEMMHRALAKGGYSHLNEVAILSRGGMAMLAEFELDPAKLRYKDQNVAEKYMQMLLSEMVLKKKGKQKK